MKMTVVFLLPAIFISIDDWAPYVFVSGGAMSLNSVQGPLSEGAVAYTLGFGRQPVI